ncbi:Protein kinase domain [Trinorchestia longiramus]|nr:Protein kinase domain [Trinorchestia longiramus]
MTHNCYIRRKKIGEGTYAVIYQADIATGCPKDTPKIVNSPRGLRIVGKVAIKKMKRLSSALDISTVREIKTLKRISHPNLCNITEVFMFADTINIVLEYAETNLEAVIRNRNVIFVPADIKWLFCMICRGLCALHRRFIVHRDLKPSNILVRQGTLKIADFGLSRPIDSDMTPNVVTRWYRAPELLYGDRRYTFAVDVWALGCILGEMLLRTPMFPADDDFRQLELIFRTLGTPTEQQWPGMAALPAYLEYPKYPQTPLGSLFSGASDDTVSLLGGMLRFDPLKRLDVKEILAHQYFVSEPRPNVDTKVLTIEAGNDDLMIDKEKYDD